MPLESLNVLLSCFSFTFLFITSVAVDILAANETFRHGDTIVSAGGNYELGFFSPGNSNNWYLGIWYKISSETVVWVANREIPLNESSAGVLKFDERGILILLNQNKSIIWSSNVSTFGDGPVAQLFDSGNFVVRHKNDYSPENFLWQSFDHPGNTFLPGMKVGTTVTGLDVYYSSWKSTEDPSKGDYTFQLEHSCLELVVKQGSFVKARTGPWNGMGFSGLPYVKPNSIYNITFVINKKERYYINELLNNTVFSRLVLSPNGVLQRFNWISGTSGWTLYLAFPADICDTYAICGVYGSCDINISGCGCLNGFVPKYQKDWDRSDWSSGCVRRTQLDCQTGDGFRLFPNVKLPGMQNSSINASMTLEECKLKCSADCSCMAYANSDIRGKGSGCYLWFGGLIDIIQYREHGQGQDLYVRMAASEIGANHLEGFNQKKELAIILSTVLTGVLLLGLGTILVWKKKQSKWSRPGHLEEHLSMDNQEDDLGLPHFNLTTIDDATNNFSFNNMLGEGGFGFVYKVTQLEDW